jgi:glycosyltransferase involved in cell wall biosynthesis
MTACSVGGSEAHVLALLSRLQPGGYELWLAYFEERPDEAASLLEDFRSLGVRTVDLQGKARLDAAASCRLLSLLRQEPFDIVHTHSLRAEVAAVAAARLLQRRPRVIRTVHNTDDFYVRPPASWLARTSSRFLDGVIAISDAVAQHVRKHTGLTSRKVRRIYYGLDPAPYDATGSSTDRPHPPTIGMIARLAPQKGHRVLLDALPAIVARVPDLRVVLVGHEHLLRIEDLRAYARKRGVAGHVTFTGFRDEVPALLAGWDVLVLPSLWEGFGLVLVEAMAAGRPVVASRVGPIPEVVLHGETGLLVEPGDPGQLAAALIELLEQPGLAARLGAAGRRRVAEHFSLDRMVAETEAFYGELLGVGADGATSRAQ